MVESAEGKADVRGDYSKLLNDIVECRYITKKLSKKASFELIIS
ncbi:hypothetical protein W04_2886 [Pseudoalteromonas sp. SW0106-04]|nr:hypothetical protein W04_2886 [Pseudoalteromonas sp. SW0106-04]